MGNLASGLFKGMPVGGSVGQTALNVNAGAVDRWASIFSGIWMLVILVAFSGVVGVVAMPTLAAVLIVAAIGSLRIGQIESIMRTGVNSQIAMIATFVATLFLPIPAGSGDRSGPVTDASAQPGGHGPEGGRMGAPPGMGSRSARPPIAVTSHHVTVLHAYGSLYYAGARTLQARLPLIGEAVEPVVVIRIRGARRVWGHAFKVLLRLRGVALRARPQGKLYLSGVDRASGVSSRTWGTNRRAGPVEMVEATPARLGESSLAAIGEAETWVIEHGAGRAGRGLRQYHRGMADGTFRR